MEKIKCKCHGKPLTVHTRDMIIPGMEVKPFRCPENDFWCCPRCGGLIGNYSKDFPKYKKFDCQCRKEKKIALSSNSSDTRP